MIKTENKDSIIVKEEEKDLRIDKLLSLHYEKKSRTYFQYLIKNDCVLINGEKIKKRTLSKEGDKVEIFFRLTPEISLEPQKIALDILYEDEDLIVINKPRNMVVHPAPGNWKNTFVNALLYHCQNLDLKESSKNLRPGIVHRLDKDTTGVLLAAKNEDVHRQLIDQFAKRTIKKKYLAICLSNPKNQIISEPIARNKIKRKEMAVSPEGKKAITEIKNLAYKDDLSLIMAKPSTGRTHQIRVHLKHIKAPIVGDKVYGCKTLNQKLKINHQLLHAYQIKFFHPTKKNIMEITAPLPSEFPLFFNHLDKFFLEKFCNFVD